MTKDDDYVSFMEYTDEIAEQIRDLVSQRDAALEELRVERERNAYLVGCLTHQACDATASLANPESLQVTREGIEQLAASADDVAAMGGRPVAYYRALGVVPLPG